MLVFPDPLLERIQGIEFLFRALEVQELHLDVFSVKIFFQSHDIGFHPDRIFALNSRFSSDVTDSAVKHSINQYAGNIDTKGRQVFLRRRKDICSWKAQNGATNVVSMHDLSVNGIRFAQKLIRLLDIAPVQFLPDIGAADIPMIVLLFLDDDRLKTVFRSELAQKLRVSGSLIPKAAVRSDHHGLRMHLLYQHLGDKIFR